MSVDEGAVGRQANFLQKLFDFLALDPHPCPEVIYWAVDSKQLVIAQPDRLAREVLPKLYKHDKIASFGRQLNIYGFSRVFPGRQFKDASGMVLDASVWSHPVLHRLSTPTEVLSVKRRAAPKLFRNRRLANGQTVRTKAGPEVERKFRAIKEDMAMERRLKHFASSGMGAGAAAGAHVTVGAGHQAGADLRGQDRAENDDLATGYHVRNGSGYGNVPSSADDHDQGYTRGMSDSMRIDGPKEAEYDYYDYEDIGTRAEWMASHSHSLSPTFDPSGDGRIPVNPFNPSGPYSKSSLEPIAEHAHPAHPHRLGMSPTSTIPLSLSPTSPLSPPIPGLSTPNYAPHHIGRAGGEVQMAHESGSMCSMWQSPNHAGPIPSYFDHHAQAIHGHEHAVVQPQTRDGGHRVYSSCPASIHSSPTFKPMTQGLRPIMEDPFVDQMGTQVEMQYSPPFPQHQVQQQNGAGLRVAAPAGANPFAPSAHGFGWAAGMDGNGDASGTPSPMGLMPFGSGPTHDHLTSVPTGQMNDHSQTTSFLAISPLSRPPDLLQTTQAPTLHRTVSQGLSIEIPPNTATFDVSMQGVGQYVSPMSGPSGPLSAAPSLQISSGQHLTPVSGGSLKNVRVGQTDEMSGTMGQSISMHESFDHNVGGCGIQDVRCAKQGVLVDEHGEHGLQQQDECGQKQKPWQMTGSIDPKWVTPQGSTFATPAQTPRAESPAGPLPMFFPSI